ncbi:MULTISPECIES: tRNA glutamyl-Q(34) synthetase GluQRS [Gammaproteobacteria]|uniref:tRNA glutamyl-Q(34) synthetase GluQRS n=1 Tax=Gammaproteobacteria TaxID=1236 RepID=UPI000DD03A93|nr:MULTISPECIES: tRNA glutamyl-Q(34) synthetase GluQRS [Gammaproteobacteria]RTE85643.1 tRNA glutamyl-Q(34) synthetase GluQRS [Aliidiomarina sp. B3213]TCZ89612.1 tRNA glutamyl-Q(34) synthetase GluQRS [Lysobacter sp. N42]
MADLATHYRGRFAPSPSGPLHAGSLVAALASYLDARANRGSWLVRIEDIDPPREVEGAADIILEQLQAHGLAWDEPVLWQSQSEQVFQKVLQALLSARQAYYCNCTRKEIQQRGGHYDGFCRDKNRAAENASVRFLNTGACQSFEDRLLGHIKVPQEFALEDFVLKRRDGLWAYQLAVVADDYCQGITHVVRGQDLLFPTVWQIELWKNLQNLSFLSPEQTHDVPNYAHVKLQLDRNGNKLSKQNHAPAIDNNQASNNLCQALVALDIEIPHNLATASVDEIITFGVEKWKSQKI